MRRTRGVIYRYGGACSHEGWYQIRTYEEAGHLPVILAREALVMYASGITAETQRLASAVWRRFLPHAREGIRWIEHYPARVALPNSPVPPETFYEVRFTLVGSYELADPIWMRIDQRVIQRIVGDEVIGAKASAGSSITRPM